METIKTIMSRESVRSFASKAIEQEKMESILEAGRVAPSWQNKQCWRFIVVQDKKTIKELALKSGFLSKANFFVKNAPVVIVLCANPKKSGHLNNKDYYLVDSAIAFQQMMLAAWDMGIGSCWLGAFNEEKVKNILNIPDKIEVIALSPFGYPAKKKSLYSKTVKAFAKSKKRKELEEIVRYDKWK